MSDLTLEKILAARRLLDEAPAPIGPRYVYFPDVDEMVCIDVTSQPPGSMPSWRRGIWA